MSVRWILLGGDAALLASLAADPPSGVECVASGGAIAASVRDGVAAGEQRFAVVGGDTELHAAVDAMRACIDAGWTGPRLPVRFPDDPSIDPLEPIALCIALLPTAPGGLAATLGIEPDARAAAAMLTTDHVWGPLDVGLVTVDDRSTVLVSTFDVGIDAQGRHVRRSVSSTLGGHLAKRRRDASELHVRDEGPLGWIAIANGQYDGTSRIAPRAVPHDRALDVLLGGGDARTVSRWRRAARRGAHVPDPSIEEWLCDHVALRFSEPVTASLDGISMPMERFEVRMSRLGIALKI